MKLMTVVGARPVIIKLSEIIKLCDKVFNHVLVRTSKNNNYEISQVFFENLGLRELDYCLGVADADLGETMGNVLSRS